MALVAVAAATNQLSQGCSALCTLAIMDPRFGKGPTLTRTQEIM